MQQNDIALEIGALNSCRSNIGKRMRELEQLASLLKHNMSVAKNDFYTANYEYAAENIGSVENTVYDIVQRLQRARTFLSNLEDRAENYLRCKFGG